MGFKVSVSNRGVVTCHSNQEPVTEAQITATASQLLKLANGSTPPVQKAKSVNFLRNVLKEAVSPPDGHYGAQWTGIELSPDARDLVADALAAAKEIAPERALNLRPFVHTKSVIIDGGEFDAEFPSFERGPDELHQQTDYPRPSDANRSILGPILFTMGPIEGYHTPADVGTPPTSRFFPNGIPRKSRFHIKDSVSDGIQRGSKFDPRSSKDTGPGLSFRPPVDHVGGHEVVAWPLPKGSDPLAFRGTTGAGDEPVHKGSGSVYAATLKYVRDALTKAGATPSRAPSNEDGEEFEMPDSIFGPWPTSGGSFDVMAHESVEDPEGPYPHFPSDVTGGGNEFPRDNASSVASLLNHLKSSDDTKE